MDNTQFNEQEKGYMSLALEEARLALAVGDYPIGAALTVNGELWGQARNSIFTEAQSTAHAEHKLLHTYSARLRSLLRSRQNYDVCLYTTLEPCLMCLGVAVLHRVSRIVVACPDPHGGATNLNPIHLGSFYAKWWPVIRTGLFKEVSCELIIEFLKTEKLLSWETMLKEFSEMKRDWER